MTHTTEYTTMNAAEHRRLTDAYVAKLPAEQQAKIARLRQLGEKWAQHLNDIRAVLAEIDTLKPLGDGLHGEIEVSFIDGRHQSALNLSTANAVDVTVFREK